MVVLSTFDEAPQVELVPVAAVLGPGCRSPVIDDVRRALPELHVAAGAEATLSPSGQAQGQFLDERGDVGVDLDTAFPLLTPKTLPPRSSCPCLTGVWHDRRQPSLRRACSKWDSSVGSIVAAAHSTTHLHCAQVPPPPQAEGRRRRSPGLQQLAAGGTVIFFSPLMSILTSPGNQLGAAAMMNRPVRARWPWVSRCRG